MGEAARYLLGIVAVVLAILGLYMAAHAPWAEINLGYLIFLGAVGGIFYLLHQHFDERDRRDS